MSAYSFDHALRRMESALGRAGNSIPSREAGEAFFKLLFTIVKNIAAQPDEPKFRTIKLSNKVRKSSQMQQRPGQLYSSSTF
eukprot:SAG11_NODE_2542_length_3237_cov_1.924841_1_plen_82_part_00